MIIYDERKMALAINIISIIIGLAIGLLGYFCYKDLITFICIFIGIMIILINIYPLQAYFKLMKENKIYTIDFIISICFIALGFMFIFMQGTAISIVFGVFCIILPIIRIIIAKQKKRQLKREIPLFIIGALMLFNIREQIFRFALVGFGAILVIIGIVNIILSNLVYKKQNEDPNLIDVDYKNIDEE